ncbi:MAG TPA: hypothetical protein VIK62_03630 [Verrucomicrobiae bacterium]
MNRATKCRWAICVLLFFVCTMNYMDRQVLGLIKPDLSKTFGWTETHYTSMAIFCLSVMSHALFHLGVPRIKAIEAK